MNELLSLSPSLVWKHFHAICLIPRISKNEQKVLQYIKNVANTQQLKFNQDKVGNIVVVKNASKGFENSAAIILQAHVDMVPQKSNHSQHDFNNDAIQAYVDGNWVKAKGTTLGADNGIGVAAMLAILESKDIQHPMIEALFTVDEEAGMSGAFALSPGFLSAKKLINLDSEDEGEVFIGCAGGMNITGVMHYAMDIVDKDVTWYELSVNGLKGGHSGLDIHRGRANANKVLNRIVYKSSILHDLRLHSIEGGTLANAIPRDAQALIAIPNQYKVEFEKYIDEQRVEITSEYKNSEPDMRINAAITSSASHVIDRDSQTHLMQVLYALPNGVQRMLDDIADTVETSVNLAVIRTYDDRVEVISKLRSAKESAKLNLATQIECVFFMAGWENFQDGEYPGWVPNTTSPLLKTIVHSYEQLYGVSPHIKVVHAGLETGIFSSVFPTMDMVSFGPTIRFAHSPDECVEIQSVEKFWNYLLAVLSSLR